MKKLLFALWVGLCTAFTPTALRAQYAINPVAPPPAFGFGDLWHFTVLRGAADNYNQFYVSLRVFNGSNILKVKSNTAVFTLAVGSQYFNQANMAPLQPLATSYYDASVLQQAIASGGLFPPGTYNIAYTLYGKTADGEFTPLADDALQLLVEAMWPPMLLTPGDGDTINTVYPLLTWTPAFSSSYTGPIEYTLNLVEVFPGQNAYQAIAANPNYFTQSGIPVTTLPYPAAAQALDTGKVYAWQVHATGGGSAMGSSEVWRFTLANAPVPAEKREENKIYWDIKKMLPTEIYRVTDGFIYLKYEEEYNSATPVIQITVLDKKMNPTTTDEKGTELSLTRGLNRFNIPQCSLPLGKFSKGDYFYLKIKNVKGEIYTVKFYPQADIHCP